VTLDQNRVAIAESKVVALAERLSAG